MTSICVMPARGGSKRIPRKNLRPFAGIPIITRTIGVILESGIVERVVVSTDDAEIAELARGAGAEVPFLRAPELAGDHVATIPVVADTLTRWSAEGRSITDPVWVVYPTAVLLEPSDLRDARDAFDASNRPVAMSVVESPAPIERAWRRFDDGRGRMVAPDHADTRTQDLPASWFDAGQFYVADSAFWLGDATLAEVSPLLLPLPRRRVVDIDTLDDWDHAEALFAANRAAASTSASWSERSRST